MAITSSFTAHYEIVASAASKVIDISLVPDGHWVYMLTTLGVDQATPVVATGWTLILEGNEGVRVHYALHRRKKDPLDSTFTISWPTATKGAIGIGAWGGLSANVPDEGAVALLRTTPGTTYPTASATPTRADRWAATFTWSRSSTAANKAIAFTPDAALTERLDFNTSAGLSAPWLGQQFADSNSAVAQVAQSYTAIQVFSESHGGAVLLFLAPEASGTGTASAPLTFSSTITGTRTRPGVADAPLGGLTANVPQSKRTVNGLAPSSFGFTATSLGKRSAAGTASAPLKFNAKAMGGNLVNAYDGRGLKYHINRKAGTLVGDEPQYEAQAAANIWAGTTGLDLLEALNVKAGNTMSPAFLAAPVLTLGAASAGGTFAAGSYFWKVTAVNPKGETVGSNEVTATLTLNQQQALSWTSINGATTYKLYRGTATNAENVLVATVSASPYTDTGTAGTAATPPGANTAATFPYQELAGVLNQLATTFTFEVDGAAASIP